MKGCVVSTFREWVVSCRGERGPVGDFVEDAWDDDEFPWDAQLDEMVRYLTYEPARQAVVVAYVAWMASVVLSPS